MEKVIAKNPDEISNEIYYMSLANLGILDLVAGKSYEAFLNLHKAVEIMKQYNATAYLVAVDSSRLLALSKLFPAKAYEELGDYSKLSVEEGARNALVAKAQIAARALQVVTEEDRKKQLYEDSVNTLIELSKFGGLEPNAVVMIKMAPEFKDIRKDQRVKDLIKSDESKSK